VPLADLIEIVPLDKPVRAEITVPGSKSITNRALILAALAEGETTLQGALWSEDTQVMAECLQELGFMVNLEPDPSEPCNRTITVYGKGGTVPPGGTENQPVELFVGNAGTAARFLAAFVCLGKGVYRLQGIPRMHERPQGALFKALRELGYRVESANDRLPALIFGDGPHERKCRVSIEESSQFASALQLCARAGRWQVEVLGDNEEESPYVRMTSEIIKAMPADGGRFRIELDASSGSYFQAAAVLAPRHPSAGAEELAKRLRQFTANPGSALVSALKEPWPVSLQKIAELAAPSDPELANWLRECVSKDSWITVRHWPRTTWQIDSAFPYYLHSRNMPAEVPPEISRRSELGDSIMMAIVLAPFQPEPWRFTDLGRMRLQECERVVALRTELSRCGAKIVEEGDTLTVFPSKLHGAEIETYNDHRMAMSFAILGLKVPGMRIRNPACVKKTFPNFFQKLAAAPPGGLGVSIRDGRTARILAVDELFAE
jgi:5-enolpyruvylshikimate-3-phosphate synthase